MSLLFWPMHGANETRTIKYIINERHIAAEMYIFTKRDISDMSARLGLKMRDAVGPSYPNVPRSTHGWMYLPWLLKIEHQSISAIE